MTNTQFIEYVVPIIKKYAPQYGIKVYSPIIAQCCKESSFGTSELAVNANNILGIKLKKNRTPIAIGGYDKASGEVYDGQSVIKVSTFCRFNNWEECIIGYFQFITTSTAYNGLQGLTDAETYCHEIKKAGYATGINYDNSLINDYIKKYDLTKYDDKVQRTTDSYKYTNSPLVTYKKISPNRTSPRNHEIDTITIHCFVGQCTAQSGCNAKNFVTYNATSGASCNYVVGYDGSIGLCVEEKDRSWCTGGNKPAPNGITSRMNDHRAITIEVACETTAPYKVTDKAYEALINLCADICKRNNIKKLLWKGDISLVGKIDQQNMTVHRWFAAKACPGDYLYNLHGDIANRVNAKLGESSVSQQHIINNTNPTVKPSNSSILKYTVQRGDNLNKIASMYGVSVENIISINKQKYPKITANYIVVGWIIDIPNITVNTNSQNVVGTQKDCPFIVLCLDNLNIRKEPNGTILKQNGCKKGIKYTITKVSGNWGYLKSGSGWICITSKYVKRC